jgi:hypothetical protein
VSGAFAKPVPPHFTPSRENDLSDHPVDNSMRLGRTNWGMNEPSRADVLIHDI